MSLASRTLHPPHTRPLQDGVEVNTPRGYGKIVCRFSSHEFFPTNNAYIVELDDDGGRTVVMSWHIQVVEHVGS